MLQFSELKKRNLLSAESMSVIRGGGSCGYTNGGHTECGVSKQDALEGAAGGGHWCCDSCWQSTYCAAKVMAY